MRQHRISLRKGAELLGLSYRECMALASRHQVSLFAYQEGELERELADLQALKAKP